MEVFSGGILDRGVMEKAGCLKYTCTPWELEKGDVYERQIHYKFDKNISHYSGEVTSTQQRSTLSDNNGWLVEEVLTFHGIPLGDYFNVWCMTAQCIVAIIFSVRLIFCLLYWVGRIDLRLLFFCSFILDTKLRIYPPEQRLAWCGYFLELHG